VTYVTSVIADCGYDQDMSVQWTDNVPELIDGMVAVM
jgi:hypothetical protein